MAFGSFGGTGTDNLFMLEHIPFKLILTVKLPTNNFSRGSIDGVKGVCHDTRGCTYAKDLEWKAKRSSRYLQSEVETKVAKTAMLNY